MIPDIHGPGMPEQLRAVDCVLLITIASLIRMLYLISMLLLIRVPHAPRSVFR